MLLFGKLSLSRSFTESFEWMQKLWSTQHAVITLQDRSTSKQGKLVSFLKRHFSKPIAFSTVWQDVLSVLLNHRLCAAVRRPLSRKGVNRYGLRGYAESPVEKKPKFFAKYDVRTELWIRNEHKVIKLVISLVRGYILFNTYYWEGILWGGDLPWGSPL